MKRADRVPLRHISSVSSTNSITYEGCRSSNSAPSHYIATMNLKLQVTVGPYHRFVVSVFVSPTFLVGRPVLLFVKHVAVTRLKYARTTTSALMANVSSLESRQPRTGNRDRESSRCRLSCPACHPGFCEGVRCSSRGCSPLYDGIAPNPCASNRPYLIIHQCVLPARAECRTPSERAFEVLLPLTERVSHRDGTGQTRKSDDSAG